MRIGKAPNCRLNSKRVILFSKKGVNIGDGNTWKVLLKPGIPAIARLLVNPKQADAPAAGYPLIWPTEISACAWLIPSPCSIISQPQINVPYKILPLGYTGKGILSRNLRTNLGWNLSRSIKPISRSKRLEIHDSFKPGNKEKRECRSSTRACDVWWKRATWISGCAPWSYRFLSLTFGKIGVT